MKRLVLVGVGMLIVVAVITVAATSQFMLSALPEPGKMETYLAIKVKHYLVHRGSREGIPRAPIGLQASIKEGDRLFGTDCGECHGASGHNPTDAGRWMYPRVADLTSADVQSYSDREIFWIVKNGIRLSGMPAFGKVESDDHIWDLALFIRSLGQPSSRRE